MKVGIITQDRYDTWDDLQGSKESRDSFASRSAASLKPSWDDPIRALVLTGDNVEQLALSDWNMIFSEYMEIVFARTTPEQKLKIVEETKKRGDNVVAVVSSLMVALCSDRTYGPEDG